MQVKALFIAIIVINIQNKCHQSRTFCVSLAQSKNEILSGKRRFVKIWQTCLV